jgi:hypothetical protein
MKNITNKIGKATLLIAVAAISNGSTVDGQLAHVKGNPKT